MRQNYKVIAVTPAGRSRYLKILLNYVLRDYLQGVIDEWHLWMNTVIDDDIQYCRSLAEKFNFIKLVEADPEITITEGKHGYSIYQFYRNCVDENTVYVRLDDDIVFIEENAIKKLVDFRIENPGYFLVFANIINNAICSHLHQRFGMLPSYDGRLVGYHCLDPLAWETPEFAEYVHRVFLNHYLNNNLEGYKFNRWELYMLERYSINCFAFFGKDFAEFGGRVGEDEEFWLSQIKPEAIGRANVICGQSLVSHFSFFTQREFLDQTDLLEQYVKLIAHEIKVDPWTFSVIT